MPHPPDSEDGVFFCCKQHSTPPLHKWVAPPLANLVIEDFVLSGGNCTHSCRPEPCLAAPILFVGFLCEWYRFYVG